jgi:chromosome segregation ATPase
MIMQGEPSNIYPSASKGSSDKKSNYQNAHNYEYVQRMEAELQHFRVQESYIDQIKQILHEKELALRQEKLKNEQKSLKVLDILKNKDKIIESLRAKLAQLSHTSTSFQVDIQNFEQYKRETIEELEQKRNLFKLKNDGTDVENIYEFKEEINRITSQLTEKVEEINNYNIVLASLEERNQSLLITLEQSQATNHEMNRKVKVLETQVNNLGSINDEQKNQVDLLVARVTSLADDNLKSHSERSKTIDKSEDFVNKITELTNQLASVKNEKLKIESENESIKDIHLSFLETCNGAINPGMKIGDD